MLWKQGRAALGGDRDQVEALPTSSTDPHERFQVMMQVRNLGEHDVANLTGSTFQQALVYGVVLLAATAFGVWSLVNNPSEGGLLGVLETVARFVAVPVLAAFYLKAALFNWQLRHRALIRGLDFFRDPSKWIPSPKS